ncbi:uncharacterized protein L3040_002190 [Drepanopeziza brunnea f. sp. 'multigermtubi']|uniref:Beta-glucosidase n=1 Tax=Marssonina brunnea f. sp. multigermtubi (strain MB_m1) TaxID=1072389 RepID=K1X514_MARBU|nr:uncharacterized protein MBM_02089 [Drepanopeziza brunnea f. sp. 'multigermtubi' MB_m1]EKD20137.1 hypothetical protein MBM_02089 [Drepanopeziza brunnea f. sp. 'multigermtubi' MB_m1]KAJ5050307.1 hypothetical protein L3040_002190 [Drepanopeziza brunnea f. sp. 'multigermtubi']
MEAAATEKVRDLKGVLRPDFCWGYATAATQVEGAWDVDGKGESIWDRFAHTPGKVHDASTPDDAVLSYYQTKEDVALLKSYGVTGYRFSLAWTRIVPLGGKDDAVNEEGIAYYSGLIDELLANGITPFVTLFHWDMPQALEDRYGGMLNQEMYTADFVRYADVCFARFGDRGDASTEPFVVGHTQLISHAYAVQRYREKFQPTQQGQIGITLHGNFSRPWDAQDARDVAAAQRALEFEIAWFADPVHLTGDYPASMRAQLGERLPAFAPAETRLVRGSSDFYGLNSYTTFFVRHLPTPPPVDDHSGNVEKLDADAAGVSRGPASDTYWLRTAPGGFRLLLSWVWKRYGVPIYITENGTTATGETEPSESVLDDRFRIEFFQGYIESVGRAVKEDGVDVRSYFAWTFTDNWEWAAGYSDRFGVTFVDFESQDKKRYPKKSATVIKELFQLMVKSE